MGKKSLLFLCLIGMILKPSPLYAYRPLVSEDGKVLEPWHMELEAGHDFIVPQGTDKIFDGLYTVNAGIFKNFQASFYIPVIYNNRARVVTENTDGSLSASKTDTRGIGDLMLLMKYALVKESKWLPAIAAVGTVRFATGDSSKGLGEPDNSYQTFGAATKTWKRLSVHLNAGWNFIPENQDKLLTRAAADFEITPKWRAIMEWSGTTDFDSSTDNDVSGLLAGFIFPVTPRLKFDVAARAGLVEEDDNITLTTGMTLAL